MDALIIIGAKYLIVLPVVMLVGLAYVLPAEKRRLLIWLAGISLPLAYIVGKLASLVYFDPRPFVVLHISPLLPHVPDNGFPSDHMLLAATLAHIAFIANKRFGMVLWGIAILIGAARVAAYIHHPLDIFGSAVISVVSVSIAAAIVKILQRKKERE